MAERPTPQEDQHRDGPTEGAIVVQRAYDLSLWVLRKVEDFPRAHRYTLGDRLVARALDLVEFLAEAAYSHDKLDALDRANRSVDALRLLLRLAEDLKLLGDQGQEFAAVKLEEIGRMAGGRRKSLQRSPR